MDKKTVFIKTAKGEREGADLSSDLKRIMSLIDNKSKADELAKRAPPSLREGWMELLGELVEGGYICDKNKPSFEPKIAKPKSSLLKMFTPKPTAAAAPPMEELDYNTAYAPNAAELAAKQKANEAARMRAEMEAAVAAAKLRASAEAEAKAEAKAKQEAEAAARARALVEAEEAGKAEYKAKKEAESAARARAAADAREQQGAALHSQAEAKAKLEAAARMKEQQEAAKAKAALEAAMRVRAEIEAAARAQQVAESKARMEAEASAKIKAELVATAKAKAEIEARAKMDAEAARLKAEREAATIKAELEAAARAKVEAEQALLKAEKEAARVKAELEAARVRAEAEAKAAAEARARQLAEEKAKQEAEVARLKAEQEAVIARLVAEAEEKARQEAGEKARLEAEAARLKVQQEATIARAVAEAEAKARNDAENKSRQEAEAARIRLERETARIRAEHEAMLRAGSAAPVPPAYTPAPPSAPAFEIQLDDFMKKTAEPAAQAPVPSGRAQAAEQQAEAERRAATEAKLEADKLSIQNVAAEMARLKEEAEAVRRKADEDARRRAEERALEEEQAKAWAEAEQRAKAQAIIEAEQAVQQAALSQARATITPIARKHRKPLPLVKIVFGLSVLALMAALIVPYVYPLAEYIAPLEGKLSALLKQPVRVGGMSASSIPPALKLQNVTLGNAKEVKIGSVELNFDLFSLLSEVKVVSDATLDDVSIQGNVLDKQVASLKLLGSDLQYPVRHLNLQRVKIVTDEIAVPELSGIAELADAGSFSRIALHSADDKLGIDLQPVQGHWELGVNLKERSLPMLPNLVFGDLSAKGIVGDEGVNFSEIDAHLFNGILLGKAKLTWSKGWQLQGSLEAKTFDLDKMFDKYGITGELYGEGAFSMSGAKLSQLGEDPRLDGSFSVKSGTINIDVVETARLMSREHLVGGRTHFDELIGLVQYENNASHFRQLKIISGMLSASGSFDVLPGSQLSGNLNAEIKMRPGNNPLTLYGTLTEPKLRAGR
ncbi:MAG: hypothetical protein HZB47_13540 [Nitrosomonadales bacterium]|nr:hypothetical protein [Nitrosomonadales bacterium]